MNKKLLLISIWSIVLCVLGIIVGRLGYHQPKKINVHHRIQFEEKEEILDSSL